MVVKAVTGRGQVRFIYPFSSSPAHFPSAPQVASVWRITKGWGWVSEGNSTHYWNAALSSTLKAAVYSPFPSCRATLWRQNDVDLAGATGFGPGHAPLFFFQRRATKRKQEYGRVRRHILMRLVAKASFFICSILLCGVGLYFFANKPWFYVSAVYCCCGQRWVIRTRHNSSSRYLDILNWNYVRIIL